MDSSLSNPITYPKMLDVLLTLLKKIDDNKNIRDYGDNVILSDNSDVTDAVHIAEDVLITDTGAVNWEAVNVVRQHGYNVFPMERDSFGWLTGGISTNKGILMFG
jgi:hypothetical protein